MPEQRWSSPVTVHVVGRELPILVRSTFEAIQVLTFSECRDSPLASNAMDVAIEVYRGSGDPEEARTAFIEVALDGWFSLR